MKTRNARREPRRATSPRGQITADMLPKLYEVGEASIAINRLDEAAWCFERAAAFDPAATRHLKGLAQTRQLQGRPDEARTLIELAVARAATAENCTIMGQICQSQGDFAAAIAAFRSAIAIDPTHAPAHLRLALLRASPDPAARISELERIAALPPLDPDQAAVLGFALGRECETAGDHERAFAAYRRANEQRRAQHPGYANTFASAEPMMRLFTPAFLHARTTFGDASQAPVFIVGMMRSGTTLVEQILATHPQVHGHGELSDIRQIAAASSADCAATQDYPQSLTSVTPDWTRRYAGKYLASRHREAPTALRHIDKMPHNFEHLGLISLLFPRARIIRCIRDPIDTCLSNYFQDFGHLNPFTYDLATLGRYHREQDRLMAHWQSVLPNPILSLPYESLVADPEGWSRKAVEFLGLPWNDACLRFHENQRPVFTKSLWQVRQPIFHSSIGRWRPYKAHLGPLLDALDAPA